MVFLNSGEHRLVYCFFLSALKQSVEESMLVITCSFALYGICSVNHTGDVVSGRRLHQLALWCVLLETVKAEWSFPGTSILAVILIYDFKNMLS